VLGLEFNLCSIQRGESVPVKTQGLNLTAVMLGFVVHIRYRKAGSTKRSDVPLA